MKVRSTLRDCLYLNWALPLSSLPEPPAPLSYEVHEDAGRKLVFASAVVFRHQGLHLEALPLPRLSHPQANFRLYVQDGQNVPSVLLRRMLVPAWVLPAAWLNRQPMTAAQFELPARVARAGSDSWRWCVGAGSRLAVEARLGSPMAGSGPRLSSWDATVTYFRHRPRGYILRRGRLSRIDAAHPRVEAWPLQAEILEGGLAAEALGVSELAPLHSAFLCPEVPMSFELALGLVSSPLPSPAPMVAADPARCTPACRGVGGGALPA